MSDQLRLGFVGGGINSAVGMVHLLASKLDRCFSVEGGVFSRDKLINKQTAERYCGDGRRAFLSIEQMVSEIELDAVAVVTPTPSHIENLRQLARFQLPVICEKPLVCSLSEWELIKDLWQEREDLYVTYNYTGYPMVREARDLLASREFGDPLQIIIEMPNEGMVRPPRIGGKPSQPQKWRLNDGVIPQACLDLTTHGIQMARFLLGAEIATAQGRFINHTKFDLIRDTGQIIGSLTNGASFSIWTTKSAFGCRNGLNFRVYCESGALSWVQTSPEVLQLTDSSGKSSEIDRSNSTGEGYQARYDRFKVGHPAGYIEAFANYYADVHASITSVAGGRSNEFLFSMKDSLEELIVLETLVNGGTYERAI